MQLLGGFAVPSCWALLLQGLEPGLGPACAGQEGRPAAMVLGIPLLVGSLQPLTIDGLGGFGLLLAESQ